MDRPFELVAGCRRRGISEGNIGAHEPKTELTVAGSAGVPAGKRLEEVAQPGALHDKGGETRVRHGGRWAVGGVRGQGDGDGRVWRSRELWPSIQGRRLVWFAGQNRSLHATAEAERSCDQAYLFQRAYPVGT